MLIIDDAQGSVYKCTRCLGIFESYETDRCVTCGKRFCPNCEEFLYPEDCYCKPKTEKEKPK